MKEKSYEEFVEKFKPKKTTDDCYTPPGIYAVVRDWACKEYGIDLDKIVRPFYPGGDYEHYDYPEGAVVLDNPPFSILAKITAFYLERGIPFFLFAPSLTCFSARTCEERTNHLICDANIVYENGAVVRTSFVTSYGGDVVAQTAPELTRLINEEAKRQLRETVKELPKYSYPRPCCDQRPDAEIRAVWHRLQGAARRMCPNRQTGRAAAVQKRDLRLWPAAV